MSDVTPVGPMTRFGRLERRGLLLGLGGAQVAVLGVAVVLMVFGMYTRGGSGLLITAVLWVPLAAVALVSVGGRPLVGWLPIVAHWHTRGLLDQTEYRVKPGRVRRVGQLALPGDAARLRLVIGPASSAALVHDPAARTLTAVAYVSAPAFDLVDTDTQHARVDGWGRLLASLTPSAGVARVQVLARTVPETGVELARYWAEHGVRDGSWAAHVVADLVATAPSRARHEIYLAVSVDVPRAGAVGKAAAALQRQMPAVRAAATRADLHVERWLDKAALGWVLRTAYDPSAAALTPVPVGDAAALAGPVAVSEEWDRLRADGVIHAVYWITEWPREDTPAAFLQPLIFADATHALSIVATPSRPRKRPATSAKPRPTTTRTPDSAHDSARSATKASTPNTTRSSPGQRNSPPATLCSTSPGYLPSPPPMTISSMRPALRWKWRPRRRVVRSGAWSDSKPRRSSRRHCLWPGGSHDHPSACHDAADR